jgi:hypothetical protein
VSKPRIFVQHRTAHRTTLMKRLALHRCLPVRLAALAAPLIAAWPQRSSAVDQSWDGGTGGTGTAWYTLTNWASDTGFPGDTNTATAGEGSAADIATINAGTNTGLGINMNTSTGLTLGAIDFGRTTGGDLTIGNSGTTGSAGFLRLNGATVNSVANTLIRNTGSQNLTIAGTAAGGSVNTTLRLGIANGIIMSDTGRTTTISAVMESATAGFGFTKTGAGTLVLSGANTSAARPPSAKAF